MTDFLIKTFIRDSEQVHDPAVRERYGVLSGVVGILLNLLLSAGKLCAGVLSASISITADAFNNLSDAGSSVVTLVGFKLAGQKADDGHPFGHGRLEYLTGLLVSLVILLVGLELGKSSIEKILHPEPGLVLRGLCDHSGHFHPGEAMDVPVQPPAGPPHRLGRHGRHRGPTRFPTWRPLPPCWPEPWWDG